MRKILSFIIAVLIAFVTIMPAKDALAVQNDETETISIMFTHDMHSHAEERKITENGNVVNRGGFARIATVRDTIEKNYPGSFMFDSGDFTMGTPFQTIVRSEASELMLMAQLGYDATTIGNHEFDNRASGLADMLNAAAKSENDEYQMPAIVGTNIDWNSSINNAEMAENAIALKKAFDNYGVKDYTIIEKNGIRIAVFGLIGDEAIGDAPEAGLVFEDYVSRAEKIVDEIQKNEEADMIVCLSHSGTYLDNPEESEDVILAEEVKGIDVIVSGHSHTLLEEPMKVGDTYIVSCGEYTDNVGHIVLEKKGESISLKDYEIIPLDETVEKNAEIQKSVNAYKQMINSQFFNKYGYSYDQVLAENSYEFTPIKDFAVNQGEETLANLITDSYFYAVEKAEGGKGDDIDVAIIPAGTVRASFNKGNITVADAFNVSALGSGADGSPGYPLVSVYLTGKELKDVAEVDATISDSMNVARLYTGGLNYTINQKRLFLNRATDFELVDYKTGEVEKLDDDKLYRVVGGLYSCQMLSLVKDQSYGLLSIEPKDKDGNIIENFEDFIIKNSDGSELKEWYALASYIDSFEGNSVPEKYSQTEGRKIVDNSINPFKLLKQPNRIAVMVTAIILIPIVIIGGIIVAYIRNKHRRRGFAKSMFSGSRSRSYNRPQRPRGKGYRKKHNFSVRGRRR